jgi:hypothetical protein
VKSPFVIAGLSFDGPGEFRWVEKLKVPAWMRC